MRNFRWQKLGLFLCVMWGISCTGEVWGDIEVGANPRKNGKIPQANPALANPLLVEDKNEVLQVEGLQPSIEGIPFEKADVNGDGIIDTLDLEVVGSHFGEVVQGESPWDVNGDRKVNIFDLVLVSPHIGERNLWKRLGLEDASLPEAIGGGGNQGGDIPVFEGNLGGDGLVFQDEETSFVIDRSVKTIEDDSGTGKKPLVVAGWDPSSADYWRCDFISSQQGSRLIPGGGEGVTIRLVKNKDQPSSTLINGIAVIEDENGRPMIFVPDGATNQRRIPIDGKEYQVGSDKDRNTGSGGYFEGISVIGDPKTQDIYFSRFRGRDARDAKMTVYFEMWKLEMDSEGKLGNRIFYIYGDVTKAKGIVYRSVSGKESGSNARIGVLFHLYVDEIDRSTGEKIASYRIELIQKDQSSYLSFKGIFDITTAVHQGDRDGALRDGQQVTSGPVYDSLLETLHRFILNE